MDGQAGTAGQQGAMLQRSKWTAQVGLLLHSQVPSPLAGYVLPPGEAARSGSAVHSLAAQLQYKHCCYIQYGCCVHTLAANLQYKHCLL